MLTRPDVQIVRQDGLVIVMVNVQIVRQDGLVIVMVNEEAVLTLTDHHQVNELCRELKDRAYDAFGPDYSDPAWDE